MKQATTFQEQIQKLISHGLIIENEEKAMEVLGDIGYYRLGFYFFPFENQYPKLENRDHQFREGTRFEEVVSLYYFDFDLRHFLYRYLTRIEVSLRTSLVYLISNKYKNSPTWFVDRNVMKAEYVNDFPKEIYTSKFKANNDPIALHHRRYINDKYAPAWKTMEFMTFGAIIKTYHSLRHQEDRLLIAQHFGFRQITVFENYLSILLFLRNRCAHGGVLFDLSLPNPLRKGPAQRVPRNAYTRLYGALSVVRYFMSVISENRAKEMDQDFDNALKRLCSHSERFRNLLEKCSGLEFP